MPDTGFGSVVRRLKLRYVDNMPAHTRCRHEGTVAVVVELLAIHIGTLQHLAPEVFACGKSTVVYTVEVRTNDLVVV